MLNMGNYADIVCDLKLEVFRDQSVQYLSN